jgi:opacity protein-like surface antigen
MLRPFSPMRARPLATSLLLAFSLSLTRAAAAFERQQSFGLDAGGVVSSTNGAGSHLGGNLALHYAYGVTDAFTFVAEVGGSGLTADLPSKKTPAEPGIVATGGVGAVYVFDVSRWVPYAGVLGGPAYFANARVTHPFWALDGQIAVGVDYELTRSWTVGVAYRQHFFLEKTSTYPEFTTLGLRLEYVWGW